MSLSLAKPNMKAFQELIRVLESIPEGQLALESWVSKMISNQGKENPCGTVACAIGWAAQDKWFNDQGFKLLSPSEYNSFSGGDELDYLPIYEVKSQDFIENGLKYGFYAVEYFFGISHAQAQKLFLRESYRFSEQVTPQEVIDRIKSMFNL